MMLLLVLHLVSIVKFLVLYWIRGNVPVPSMARGSFMVFLVFLVVDLVSMMIVLVLNLGSYHYVPVIAQCFSDDVPVVTPAVSYNVLALARDSFPDVSEDDQPSVTMFLLLYTVSVTTSPDSCYKVLVFMFSFLLYSVSTLFLLLHLVLRVCA